MKLPGPWRYLSHMQAGVRRLLISTAALALVVFFYLQSQHFQRQVERQLVAVVEETTGTRVELRGFHLSLRSRELQIHGLKVRSREKPDATFFEADTVVAGLRVRSLLVREAELRYLRIERPLFRVVTDEQGRTNLPRPQAAADPRRSPLDPLFELSVGQLELLHAEFQWNDIRRRLDFKVQDATAALRYELARDRYLGTLGVRVQEFKTGAKGLSANARLRFTLERRSMAIDEFALELPHSRLVAKGSLTDWRRPVIQGGYEASVDVGEGGVLLEAPALKSGTLRIKGTGKLEVASGAYRAQGQARLEKGELLSFSEIAATAPFDLSGGALNLAPLEMSVLGGKAAGQMRIDKLFQSPRFNIGGRVEGVSVARLLESLQPLLETNLERLRVASALTGALDVSFGGAAGVDVDVRAEMIASPAPPPGYLPVHGRLDFSFGSVSRQLVFRNTALQTPASQITLNGDGRYQLTAESTNPAELASLVTLPIEVQGRIRFTGTLQGPFEAPILEGRAELERFAYQKRFFDSFQGQVRYSPDRLEVRDGRLVRGRGELVASASLPLENGALAANKPFNASLQLRGVELSELQELAEVSYPVNGQVQASLVAAGTRENPSLRGAMEITRGELWGQTFERLHSNIVFRDRLLEAQNLALTRGKASINGPASFHLDAKTYTFSLIGLNLLLEDFPKLQFERLKSVGAGDFRLSGKGTYPGMPEINGRWRIRNLVVNQEPIGTVTGTLSTEAGRLFLRTATDLKQGRMDVLAGMRLEEPYAFDGRVDLTALDLDSLFQSYLEASVTTHSSVSGTLSFSGNVRETDSLQAQVTISKAAIGLKEVNFQNEAPIVANYRKQVLTVEPFKLVGKEVALEGSGTVGRPLPSGSTSPRPLSLKIAGRANPALLTLFSKHVEASGETAMSLSIEGTTDSPQVNGRVDLKDIYFATDFFPNTFNRMNGTLLFNRGGARIDRLTGESGGGPVEFTGFLDYSHSPATFELRTKGSNIRTRYPPGVSTTLDTQWTLTGNTNRALMNGEMIINRMGVNPNFDLAFALAQIKQASILMSDESWARKLDMQFRVVSSGDVRFDSSKTRNLQAEVDLRVRGTAADLALLGKITLLEGQVDFAGNHYTINRGDIEFTNPFRIDPILNLDVSTRAQQYDIGLDFSGPLDKLQVNYRSDPPLPVADIQALLFLGRTPAASGANAALTNPALQQAVTGNTVLQQAMAATSGSRLERFFGAARLKFDPQSGSVEQNSSARLTLEQQVAPDVTLTYITSLNNTQQQIVQVEWAVSQRLSLLAVRDQNGLFGIDLRWKKRFR